jgi:hypothetical protein
MRVMDWITGACGVTALVSAFMPMLVLPLGTGAPFEFSVLSIADGTLVRFHEAVIATVSGGDIVVALGTGLFLFVGPLFFAYVSVRFVLNAFFHTRYGYGAAAGAVVFYIITGWFITSFVRGRIGFEGGFQDITAAPFVVAAVTLVVCSILREVRRG